MLKEEVFKVNGMGCAHCEKRVEAALKALEGVDRAQASAQEQCVRVAYDDAKAAPQALKDAVDGAGYELLLP